MQNYLYFLFLALSITYVISLSQVRNCENCKWFSKNINNNNMDFCKLFSINYDNNDVNKVTYNFAKHCRDNEFLCGKNGWFYDDINNLQIKYVNLLNDNQINKIESNTNNIFEQNEFFSSLNKKEYDQIIKDYNNLNAKNQEDEKKSYDNYVNNIAKKNIKKIYKKEKDIYKLFKKN